MSIVLVGSTSGSITLQEPAVAGSTVLSLPATTGTVLTSASPSSDLPSSIKGPAFSAYGSAFNSVANATFTKISFNTKSFDTNSNYDTTNFRFLPTVAGYYQVNAICAFANASSGIGAVYLYKNGSSYSINNGIALNSSNTQYLQVSNLVFLNGSTDYIEIYVYQTSGGNLNVGSNGTQQQFSASMVRGA